MKTGVWGLSFVIGACQAPLVRAMCVKAELLLSPVITPSICLGKPDAGKLTSSSDRLDTLAAGAVGTLHITQGLYM